MRCSRRSRSSPKAPPTTASRSRFPDAERLRVRAGRAVPGGGPESGPRRRVLRRPRPGRPAVVCRQRGGAPVSERRDRSRRPPSEWLTRFALMSPATRRTADAVLRRLPQLRDQLQPRQGPGEAVHRVARRHRREPRQAVAGVHPACWDRRGCHRGCGPRARGVCGGHGSTRSHGATETTRRLHAAACDQRPAQPGVCQR